MKLKVYYNTDYCSTPYGHTVTIAFDLGERGLFKTNCVVEDKKCYHFNVEYMPDEDLRLRTHIAGRRDNPYCVQEISKVKGMGDFSDDEYFEAMAVCAKALPVSLDKFISDRKNVNEAEKQILLEYIRQIAEYFSYLSHGMLIHGPDSPEEYLSQQAKAKATARPQGGGDEPAKAESARPQDGRKVQTMAMPREDKAIMIGSFSEGAYYPIVRDESIGGRRYLTVRDDYDDEYRLSSEYFETVTVYAEPPRKAM